MRGIFVPECVYVLVAKSCLTLCDPMDCSLSGSSVHGILQARILEWVVLLSSRGASQHRIEPGSPALRVDSLSTGLPGNPLIRGDLGTNGKETQPSVFEEEVRDYSLEEEMCRLRPEESGVRWEEW